MQHDLNLTFIGGGNMASALIGGLVAQGFPATRIRVSEPGQTGREHLASRFGVATFSSNIEATAQADVVVLAVKPQVLQSVCRELAGGLQAKTSHPLIISIAAGISTTSLQQWLGAQPAIVRAMPNTPAMVGEGAAGLFATAQVSDAQKCTAEALFQAVGTTTWVEDEDLIHAITALSGSGPAYFFLILEALENAAVAAGLPADGARQLAIQTMAGAARMARDSGEEPAQLKRNVMSPGGTTERAIQTFEAAGLPALITQAFEAARLRSAELAELLGKSA